MRAKRDFCVDIDVRWGDMDAFGHVNNTRLVAYLEDARIAWMDAICDDWQTRPQLPALVNLDCNFRREIVYPCQLRVHVKANRASERRVLHRYIVRDRNDPDQIYADAESTIVWIDLETRTSLPVPEYLAGAL